MHFNKAALFDLLQSYLNCVDNFILYYPTRSLSTIIFIWAFDVIITIEVGLTKITHLCLQYGRHHLRAT